MRMEHFQILSTHPNPCYTQVILLAAHASSKLRELNYDNFALKMFIAFQPHLVVMFCLNSH
jgi:hypothetical protein